jgi:hypothetical protein
MEISRAPTRVAAVSVLHWRPRKMICSRYRFIRAAASGVAAELAAAIIASCSEKSTEPQPVEKSLKIAFESDRDGNEEIYVMNRDGTNQKRLTNNPGRDGSFS